MDLIATPWGIGALTPTLLTIAFVLVRRPSWRLVIAIGVFVSAAVGVILWMISGMNYEDFDLPFPWWWSWVLMLLLVEWGAALGYIVVRAARSLWRRRAHRSPG